MAPRDNNAQVQLPFYNYNLYVTKSQPWAAAKDVMAINLSLFSFDRYIVGFDWAKISPVTMKKNLNNGFEWDWNAFETNYFMHPYNGAMYYNAARCHGLNFWQSVPYALGGSLIWELLLETEPPSTNDLINTTLDGIVLGEIFYRLSALILDDRAAGTGSKWPRVAAFMLNPVLGMNRLFSGQLQTRGTGRYLYNPLHGSIDLGTGFLTNSLNAPGFKDQPIVGIHSVYGDPFRKIRIRAPYDFFEFRAWVRLGKSPALPTYPYLNIYGFGNLYARKIGHGETNHMFAIFQDYDFLHTESIAIGSTAVTIGLLSNINFAQSNATTIVRGGPIILGGSNTEYIKVDIEKDLLRNYNFGSGYTIKVQGTWNTSISNIYLLLSHYSIYTLSGAVGSEHLNMANLKYQIRVWNDWGIGVEYTHYFRDAFYKDFPDVHREMSNVRSYLCYMF